MARKRPHFFFSRMKRTRDDVVLVKDDADDADVAIAAVVAGSSPSSFLAPLPAAAAAPVVNNFDMHKKYKDTAPSLPPLSGIFELRMLRTLYSRVPDKGTRHLLLQAVKERVTADGFVARMPALATAPLDELITYARSLFDFLRVPGNGHNLVATTDCLAHLVSLMENVRTPILDYVTRTIAAKRAQAACVKAQCDLIAVLDDVRRHARDPGHITASGLQKRMAAVNQSLSDTVGAWFRAVDAAPHALGETLHQQLVATLTQVRSLLLHEVPPVIREVLFSDIEV